MESLESLREELAALKMSVSMLTTLIQSHQMLLNNLNKAAGEPSNEVKPKSRVVSPKKVELTTRVHEWLSDPNHIIKAGLTLSHFIVACEEKIKGLPLQDTGERLDITLTQIVKTVYESIDPKKKPFFSYGKPADRKLVYQDKSKNWIFDADAVVKAIMFLEKNLRSNQMDQLDIQDMEHMSSHEQESYLEYFGWTTSEMSKARILSEIMDFVDKIELD